MDERAISYKGEAMSIVEKGTCKVEVIGANRERRKARNFQNSSFVDAILVSLIFGERSTKKKC